MHYHLVSSFIGSKLTSFSLHRPDNKILIHFLDDISTKLFPEVPKPSTTSQAIQETSQKTKVIKNSINALIVVGILSYFVSRSNFSPLIKVHVKRLKTSWSKMIDWMYPSTKTDLKGIPVYATVRTSPVMEDINKFKPKPSEGMSALG